MGRTEIFGKCHEASDRQHRFHLEDLEHYLLVSRQSEQYIFCYIREFQHGHNSSSTVAYGLMMCIRNFNEATREKLRLSWHIRRMTERGSKQRRLYTDSTACAYLAQQQTKSYWIYQNITLWGMVAQWEDSVPSV